RPWSKLPLVSRLVHAGAVVGVAVGTGVRVGVDVWPGGGVLVAVGVAVGVRVGVDVKVGVGSGVLVPVAVAVAVGAGGAPFRNPVKSSRLGEPEPMELSLLGDALEVNTSATWAGDAFGCTAR